MRVLLLCLVLCELVFSDVQQPRTAPFKLYVEFDLVPPDAIWTAIQDELESLITPIGWRVEWELIKKTGSISVSLAVARFKGDCSVQELDRYSYSSPPSVLGRTHISDGAILPFSDIFCDAIRASVGASLASLEPAKRELHFGRAVGRVLAHELYHILTGETDHASVGVGQGHFTREDLLAETFRFAPGDVRKLRARLVPVLLNAYDWIRAARHQQIGPSVFVSSGCSGCHGPLGEGTRWGPALRRTGAPYNLGELTATLGEVNREMYRQAAKLKLLWPSLKRDALEAMVEYMNSLRRSEFVAGTTK